ncbi:hypothetical protein [Herbaspirillum sp. YR522]|uniref:hypothetical protein n=1 Tax=Herbaspirillum sp. YR522 TaxID=1144342 RepID=UPI00026F7648|nr:hypothetical protein [Herbaspirillum sp. YR522]EJN09398.1 hypothetical protein PMI40_00846 [Herbaspirillum sp. YR522]
MATGDNDDLVRRLKQALPNWFTDETPILDALFAGFAAVWAFIYSLYTYAQLQTRIKTATDGWLDMIAADFLGTSVIRKAGQSDASFLNAIVINLFRERGTRQAVVKVLTDLTGRAPIIYEPQRPEDTGAYRAPNSGYGAAGAYGSVLLPAQAFVVAFRPATSGIPYVAGYGSTPAGYGAPSRGEYASLAMVQGAVTDAEIYAAIDSVKCEGTTVWTVIKS